MTDAEFVKNTRKSYKMSMRQFADMLGTTHQTVSNWEAGKTLPPIVKMAIQLRAEKDGVKIES